VEKSGDEYRALHQLIYVSAVGYQPKWFTAVLNTPRFGSHYHSHQ
jgi:hypothetical protein